MMWSMRLCLVRMLNFLGLRIDLLGDSVRQPEKSEQVLNDRTKSEAEPKPNGTLMFFCY